MRIIRNKEVGNVIALKFSNEPTNELRNSIVGYLLEQLIII